MFTLPSTTRDIGEQLYQQHAAQKLKNRQALYQILSSIKFLSRQGLAMRGDGNGNLQQLLRMKAEEDPNLAQWLKRKENVYTSPDIQNEVVRVMGNQVLREVAKDLQDSPFLTVMADETIDSSNREQVTLIVRRVKLKHENVSVFLWINAC